MLGPALQSVGNRASLPALKPTGQSAADSPKGSRQVLADVTGHLEPFFTFFRTAAHPERLHSDQQRTSIRRLSLMHWNSVLQRQPFREGLRFMKDSESSATRRDLFDNFLNCIRSPLHVSRLHKYVQLPTCSTQARRLHKTGLQPSCGSTELLPARAYLCSR